MTRGLVPERSSSQGCSCTAGPRFASTPADFQVPRWGSIPLDFLHITANQLHPHDILYLQSTASASSALAIQLHFALLFLPASQVKTLPLSTPSTLGQVPFIRYTRLTTNPPSRYARYHLRILHAKRRPRRLDTRSPTIATFAQPMHRYPSLH